MRKIQLALGASLLGLSLGFAPRANAGFAHSFGDAAPVINVGEYSGRLLADVILNKGGGLNITPRFKTGLVDQYFDLTTVIGAGKTDWQLGAIGKYNLLPDMDGQVGMSFTAGFHLLHNVETAINLGAGMVVSKKLQASFGEVTPYGSLELDFVFGDGDTFVPVHLNVGTIWEPMSTGPWSFITEVQFGLARGYYALTAGTSYRF